MNEIIEIRATQLPADDVDYLRSFARRQGYKNTAAGVLRFAVTELARRLQQEGTRKKPRKDKRDGRPSSKTSSHRKV